MDFRLHFVNFFVWFFGIKSFIIDLYVHFNINNTLENRFFAGMRFPDEIITLILNCLTFVDAFIPIHEFWVDSRELSELQRCGGLVSHLNRVLGGR